MSSPKARGKAKRHTSAWVIPSQYQLSAGGLRPWLYTRASTAAAYTRLNSPSCTDQPVPDMSHQKGSQNR